MSDQSSDNVFSEKQIEVTDKPRSRFYLYLTVFSAGMTTLAVEFTVSRMLQTVFGTSNLVWANVIGLVLLFLTVGYFLGGWLADKYTSAGVFYWSVTLAGLASTFSLLLMSVLLRSIASALAAVDFGAVVSSFIIVVLALAVPITLLGAVSPFAIRLGVRDVHEAGRVSGRIYAISTWGSLLGTYLPVLLVIPVAGTRVAATVFGLLLLLMGLGGLYQFKRNQVVTGLLLSLVLIPFVIAWNRGSIKDYPDQIFEAESAYNYIQVIRQGDCNYLLLNEGQAYHSYYCDEGRVPRISVWSIMLAAPFFNDPEMDIDVDNLAVIGLAAGTIPNQFSRAFGPIPIDGIELDPAIVEVGQEFFDLIQDNINVIVGDGRYELNQLDSKYDVITLDAYKVPYIPWHLTTQDFFLELKDQMSDRGVLAVNVGRAPDDRRLVEAISSTLLSVFPSVHTVDVPGSLNSILFATVRETSSDNLTRNIEKGRGHIDPFLDSVLRTAAENQVKTETSGVIFTDLRAPVESIIDSMVLNYLLREGPEGLTGLSG